MGCTILPPLVIRNAAVTAAFLSLPLFCGLADALEDASDVADRDGSATVVVESSGATSALERETDGYLNEDGFSLFQQALPRTPRDLADYLVERGRQRNRGESLLEVERSMADGQGEAAGTAASLRREASVRPGGAQPGFAAAFASLVGPTDTCMQLMWYGYGSVDECRDSWSPEVGSNCRCERQGTAWPVKYCTTGDEGEAQLAILGFASGSQREASESEEARIAQQDIWGRCEKCCSRSYFIGWPLMIVILLVLLCCLRSLLMICMPAASVPAGAGSKAAASAASAPQAAAGSQPSGGAAAAAGAAASGASPQGATAEAAGASPAGEGGALG
eukprot:TRINITY_DN121171_c0_g1_i1.p1 TRINITY_DN121171_c0_g1~~TRINITY_DN121171_c0_g1_i1.p1  ORF type:complete len:334 (+),score=78.65 TRINITY_DN121171_c0_g1_i1:111-1112(+)